MFFLFLLLPFFFSIFTFENIHFVFSLLHELFDQWEHSISKSWISIGCILRLFILAFSSLLINMWLTYVYDQLEHCIKDYSIVFGFISGYSFCFSLLLYTTDIFDQWEHSITESWIVIGCISGYSLCLLVAEDVLPRAAQPSLHLSSLRQGTKKK